MTIAVALNGQSQLGERFDEVRKRARHESQLKFGVTDVTGWQTAYGYDDGVSRPRFERRWAPSGSTFVAHRVFLPSRPSAVW